MFYSEWRAWSLRLAGIWQIIFIPVINLFLTRLAPDSTGRVLVVGLFIYWVRGIFSLGLNSWIFSILSGWRPYSFVTYSRSIISLISMGYWPSVRSRWLDIEFFFCAFMDRDGVEVHKLAKKERGQYPAILTEQAWSIKVLLYGFRGNFSCGMRRVVPSGQDSSILPARVANHRAGFDSSCPLTELAI